MDENLHNNADQFFRDSLQSSRQDMPEEIWNRIEARLDEEDGRAIAAIRRRKAALAAVLFLFILFAAGIGLIKYNSGNQIDPAADHLTTVHRDSFSRKGDKVNGSKSGGENYPVKSTVSQAHFNRPFLKSVRNETELRSGQADHQNGMSVETNAPGLSAAEEQTMKWLPLHFTPAAAPAIQIDLKNLPAQFALSGKMIVHPERAKGFRRFSVTPYFSKEIAGYSLTDNDATAADGKEIEQRERNVFSASVGLFVNYRLNKKWTLQSGISYSWSSSIIDSATSYAVKDNTGNVQFKLNTISGYGYLNPASGMQTQVGDSVSTAKTYSELHYISVPLILSYHIPIKKFSLLLGGGVTFNMLTGASIETKTYGSGYPEKEYAISMLGLKKVNYGIIVKADLLYSLSSRVGVNLITSFKNTLSPINLQSALSAYPYNLGIGMGITYHF